MFCKVKGGLILHAGEKRSGVCSAEDPGGDILITNSQTIQMSYCISVLCSSIGQTTVNSGHIVVAL